MAERRAEEARALALEGRLMAKEYAPEFVQPGWWIDGSWSGVTADRFLLYR